MQPKERKEFLFGLASSCSRKLEEKPHEQLTLGICLKCSSWLIWPLDLFVSNFCSDLRNAKRLRKAFVQDFLCKSIWSYCSCSLQMHYAASGVSYRNYYQLPRCLKLSTSISIIKDSLEKETRTPPKSPHITRSNLRQSRLPDGSAEGVLGPCVLKPSAAITGRGPVREPLRRMAMLGRLEHGDAVRARRNRLDLLILVRLQLDTPTGRCSPRSTRTPTVLL